jgi:hypothetical protein
MRTEKTMSVLRPLAVVTVAVALTVAATLAPAGSADAARPHWRVKMKADRTTVQVGKKIHFTGKVSRAAAGRLVMLQEKVGPGHRWKNQRNAVVHRDGTYRTYDRPTVNRARSYRVVMPGTKHRKRGISPKVRVVVYAWQSLTSRPAVNQSYMYVESSVAINAQSFPNSLEAWMYDPLYDTTQSIEYNLDHRCTKFRGTFGLSDDSETSGQATIVASADGKAWFTKTFSLGQSAPGPTTWATPPLKIRIESTSLNSDAMGLGAVGTPEVYCTQ